MEVSVFTSMLRKRWYVTALCLLAAVAGMFIYHRLMDMQTAQATVAVLDPLVAKPGAYPEAQVTFDAVVKSNQVLGRVAAELGIPESVLIHRVSVTLIPTLSAYNASPLFAVKGQAKTQSAAIALTNAVATEARKLYIQLNTANPAEMRAALQPDLQQIQSDLQQARTAYDSFVAANKTADLPSQIDRQRALVASLQQNLAQARAAENALGISNGRTSQSLARQLSGQQAQLDQLTSEESQFNQLSFNLQLAQERLAQFSQAEQTAVVGEQLPAQLQVKLLDAASIQSQFLWLFLTYSSAILLALLVAFSTVYLLALKQPPAQTADDIARTFGSPVLVRVPRITP